MTAPAKELTDHANPNPQSQPTVPVIALRAFVGAFGRLGYNTTSLLAAAGLTPAQLEDSDSRVTCAALPTVIGEAMRTRPLKDLGMRVAAEIPIGAFTLLDYLIVTCENVSQGMKQLARYLRIHEVPFKLDIRDEEDPVRMVYTDIPDPFTAEFEVTLPVFHLRRETGSQFRAEYVRVSSPGESHPEALAELYVSLSTHTAPIMEPRRARICQWANNSGARREKRAIQCFALRRCCRSFLYFLLAHRARSRSSSRIVG
jgi:Arabinose-binding domain of AraC transcription regulator, N-term